MIFRQITHDDLGCASYVVGDEEAGVVAVVDPRFDVEEYLRLARYLGVRIAHVLETHNHADHVSGHGRLAEATGAPVHIHRLADPGYAHEPFDHGWELELGSVRIRAIHTPGHRPEHTAFALIDEARGSEPWAVLTGDTLFVGDIARPDLAVEKVEGAHGIFRSLHEGLLTLPAETEVWPGHLGGSMCGGPGMDLKISSTIGFELAHNDILREVDEERFVERAIAGLGPQPPNFRNIVALNRGPFVTAGAEAPPLAPRQVQVAQGDGALVVDVRTDLQFDDAHIPGALCIPAVRAGFGTRLAWLAGDDREIVLVGRDDDDAAGAAALAAAVGLTRVAGRLAGGMTSWREERLRVETVERVAIDRLAGRLGEDADLQVLDVRERAEHAGGTIPGALTVPWHGLDPPPAGLDPGRPVAVVCASGERAAVAASVLQRGGQEGVVHVVDGGVSHWEALGSPLEAPAPAGASS